MTTSLSYLTSGEGPTTLKIGRRQWSPRLWGEKLEHRIEPALFPNQAPFATILLRHGRLFYVTMTLILFSDPNFALCACARVRARQCMCERESMCMCGNLIAGIMHACRLHIISPTAAEDCEIKWERVHFCLWIDCVGSILLKKKN